MPRHLCAISSQRWTSDRYFPPPPIARRKRLYSFGSSFSTSPASALAANPRPLSSIEVMPMVEELNALVAHNETQAEEARRHAGNLAHALKTPLTVIMNAATAQSDDLADTVAREARTMRRQVDHHLARALGRVDDIAVLGEPLPDFARRNEQQLGGALEGRVETCRLGVIGLADLHSQGGQIGRARGLTNRGDDLRRGHGAQQSLNDESAQLAGGAGDDDHDRTPEFR